MLYDLKCKFYKYWKSTLKKKMGGSCTGARSDEFSENNWLLEMIQVQEYTKKDIEIFVGPTSFFKIKF